MIDFIKSEEVFIKEKKQIKEVFRENVEFLHNPFNTGLNLFIAFEFDKIYSEAFYNGLIRFLKNINSEDFTFYTLSPAADTYFFTHFSKYSIVKIPVNTSYDAYIEFLDRDPGESPADALLYNAETIAIYSNQSIWGMIGSKDLEIGIVGFKESNIKNKFLTSFEDGCFTDIKTRINEIIRMSGLSQESNNIYSELLERYSLKK